MFFHDARVPMNMVTNPNSALGPVRISPTAWMPDGSVQYVSPGGGTAYVRDPHAGAGGWDLSNKMFNNNGKLVSMQGLGNDTQLQRRSSVVWGGTVSGGVAGMFLSLYSLRRKGDRDVENSVGYVVLSSALGATLGLLTGIFAARVVDYVKSPS